jgi:hypothetical protein
MSVLTYEGVVENGCVQLPEDARLPEKSKVFVVVPGIEMVEMPRRARIMSPRLAHPEQAKDFVKEVRPETSDAGV